MNKPLRFNHSIYRLVISNITDYGIFPLTPPDTHRVLNACPELDSLKSSVLDLLIQKQSKRSSKLTHWSIAWEVHPSSGLPHLDILVVYQHNIKPVITSFDYLIKDLHINQLQESNSFKPGHVWITPYSSKKLNKAILDYGSKQDPDPISNLSDDIKKNILRTVSFKADPYRYLELQMDKDPIGFNIEEYVKTYDLYQFIPNWSSVKNKLKDSQTAAANLKLKTKPGFKYIDRPLIQSSLTPHQLKTYDSWSGYQTIVNYLNMMLTQKGNRQMKTLNLLISGPASIGKTSLFHNPNHKDDKSCVQDYCSIFPMGMSLWFPKYSSGVYHMILWNQAKLTSYSYDTILKLLEGSHMDLPSKGSVSRKVDNPLVVMTSNMTLEQMISQKFGYNADYKAMARQNLAVRVQNVIVPKGYKLFILQKLLKPYK